MESSVTSVTPSFKTRATLSGVKPDPPKADKGIPGRVGWALCLTSVAVSVPVHFAYFDLKPLPVAAQ